MIQALPPLQLPNVSLSDPALTVTAQQQERNQAQQGSSSGVGFGIAQSAFALNGQINLPLQPLNEETSPTSTTNTGSSSPKADSFCDPTGSKIPKKHRRLKTAPVEAFTLPPGAKRQRSNPDISDGSTIPIDMIKLLSGQLPTAPIHQQPFFQPMNPSAAMAPNLNLGYNLQMQMHHLQPSLSAAFMPPLHLPSASAYGHPPTVMAQHLPYLPVRCPVRTEGQSSAGSGFVVNNNQFNFSLPATMQSIPQAAGQSQPDHRPNFNTSSLTNVDFLKAASKDDDSTGKVSTGCTSPVTTDCTENMVATEAATAAVVKDKKNGDDDDEFAKEMGTDENFFQLCNPESIDGCDGDVIFER